MSHELLSNLLYIIVAFSWMMYLAQELFISGASALNISLAKDDEERKQIQATAGLHFDGMEVWLIAALTLTFGGFRFAFATILPHLYVVFFLLVYVIIARGVSLEVMYKLDNKKWQKVMSYTWMISSILLMLFLGVYITNLFYGFPFDGTNMTKGFISIFSVTGISGGVFFVLLSIISGAAWINITCVGDIGKKAVAFVKKTGVIYMLPPVLLLVFMGFNNTTASLFVGDLFTKSAVLFILPFMTVVFAILVTVFGIKQDGKKMFIFTVLTMCFFIITGFVGTFPYVVLSNLNPDLGITIMDAAASKKASMTIFIAVMIFYPLIVTYQGWKYYKFAFGIKLNDE